MRSSLALAAFMGCLFATQAAAQFFDDTEARRRIDVLRQSLEANQRTLEERLTKLEGAAGDRSAILELSNQLGGLRDELAKIRGQLEVLSNRMDDADNRQKSIYTDIDARLRKLEQAAEKAAEKPAAAVEPQVTPEENKAYTAALDQFKLGNYPLAVSAMQGFLVTYPSSPLAANAQYWVGMAYSGQRDYKSAIAAQRKLLASWPDSPKAPDALLSIASSQETMGDRRSAQKTLEELIAKYPASSSAASAKQRLAVINKR
jgi:tol-pal system protein YbgF